MAEVNIGTPEGTTDPTNDPIPQIEGAASIEVSADVAAHTETAPVVPEKFRNEDGSLNQEALLKSYTELERTISAPAPEADLSAPAAGENPLTAPATPAEGKDSLDASLAKWGEEYVANGGKLTDATMKAITTQFGVDEAFVANHMRGQQAIAELQAQEIQGLVGGKEQYGEMIQWVASKLGRPEHDAFVAQVEDAMASQDETRIKSLVSGMEARWKTHTQRGWSPEITGTDPAGDAIKPFSSEAEMRAAQSTPEYLSGDDTVHRLFDQRLAKSYQMGLF